MSTIDMTQVAGIQAVNAEGNVIGTLSVDDLTELVATKIIQEAKNEAVSARSASVMSEASTLAATDEYEDKLDIDTNPAYIRSLDTNGNPKRTAIASLASVVGGLIGLANGEKNGLMSYYAAKVTGLGMIKSISNKQFIKITKLEAKAWVIGYCEIICFRTASFATQKTTKILVPMSTDSQTQQAAKPTFLCGESGEVELYKDTSNNLYVKHNYIYNMAIIVTMHSQYNSLDLEVVNDTPTGLEKIAFA